jgi:hypothetical protein
VAIADTMSFMDDRLLVTLGLRRQTIEQISFRFAYNGIVTDVGGAKTGYDQEPDQPGGRRRLQGTTTVSVYANYIEGLSRANVAPGTGEWRPVTNAGDIFAPYQAKQKEVGLKYDGGTLGGAPRSSTDKPPTPIIDRPTITDQRQGAQPGRRAHCLRPAHEGPARAGGVDAARRKAAFDGRLGDRRQVRHRCRENTSVDRARLGRTGRAWSWH